MKRITAIALTVAAVLGTSYVGNVGAAPTAWDDFQDKQILDLAQDRNAHQGEIKQNTADIAALGHNTDRQIQTVNDYVAQVQAQSNDHDAAQDKAITSLQNQPKPKDGINGKDGKDGVNGRDGVNGKDGAPGAAGARGATGATGSTGAAGRDGVDGRNGKDGAAGVTTIKRETIQTVKREVDTRTQAQVQRNSRDIDDLKKDMKGLGNNAAAQASLHFNGNRDSWAISTGSYNADGAAFAAGVQKSIGEHVAATVQASFDGEGNSMLGAGLHGDF